MKPITKIALKFLFLKIASKFLSDIFDRSYKITLAKIAIWWHDFRNKSFLKWKLSNNVLIKNWSPNLKAFLPSCYPFFTYFTFDCLLSFMNWFHLCNYLTFSRKCLVKHFTFESISSITFDLLPFLSFKLGPTWSKILWNCRREE